MNIFGIIETFINKVKDPLYLVEKDILKAISKNLPITHKEIFDYQLSKYNMIRRNKFSKSIYFYYLRYGYVVKNMEKQFAYSERSKVLARFSIIVADTKYSGLATVINGRFFSLSFDEWINFSKLKKYEISIDKIRAITI